MLILSKTHSYLVTDAAAAEQRGNEIEVFYVITNVQKYKKKRKKTNPRYTTFIRYNWEFGFFVSLKNSFSHELRNTNSPVTTRINEIKEDSHLL